MPVPTQALPTVGGANATEEPKLRAALQELQTLLGGGLDSTNISPGLLAGSDVRAKKVTATEEALTGAVKVPTALTTADSVTITTAADALVEIRYSALWRMRFSVDPRTVGTVLARASLWIDGSQVYPSVFSMQGDTGSYQLYPGGTVYSDTSQANLPDGSSSANPVFVSAFTGTNVTATLPKLRSSAGLVYELAAGSHTVEMRFHFDDSPNNNPNLPNAALMVSQRKLRVRSIAY